MRGPDPTDKACGCVRGGLARLEHAASCPVPVLFARHRFLGFVVINVTRVLAVQVADTGVNEMAIDGTVDVFAPALDHPMVFSMSRVLVR